MANRLNQKLRKPAQEQTAPVNYDRYIPPALGCPSRRRIAGNRRCGLPDALAQAAGGAKVGALDRQTV